MALVKTPAPNEGVVVAEADLARQGVTKAPSEVSHLQRKSRRKQQEWSLLKQLQLSPRVTVL